MLASPRSSSAPVGSKGLSRSLLHTTTTSVSKGSRRSPTPFSLLDLLQTSLELVISPERPKSFCFHSESCLYFVFKFITNCFIKFSENCGLDTGGYLFVFLQLSESFLERLVPDLEGCVAGRIGADRSMRSMSEHSRTLLGP